MNRLLARGAALTAVLAGCFAPAQVWEKLLLPGLTYRMEADRATPLVLHAIRFSPGSPWVSAKPDLGRKTIFSENSTGGRATVSEMVRNTGAIGGVNADFFPFTGDPLGLMVRAGVLQSAPSRRAAFGWGASWSGAAIASWTGRATLPNGESVALDGFNEEIQGDRLCLNTSDAGLARARGAASIQLLKVLAGSWTASGEVVTEVLGQAPGPAAPIPDGGAALVGAGSKASAVSALKAGDKVSFRIRVEGFDWSKVEHAVGGGPFLVRNGRIAIDWANQGFNDRFALQRHPRTAIGRTRGGDVWFAAVDGRQAVSAGATLEEMARAMIRLGCVEAVNLDGGGSTTCNLFGLTLNRPSDGRERPVANAVLFYRGERQEGSAPPTGREFKIQAPERMTVGEERKLKAFYLDGTQVPNTDVIWACSGDAWIDQGGTLRPVKEGRAMIQAWVGERAMSAEILIQGAG